MAISRPGTAGSANATTFTVPTNLTGDSIIVQFAAASIVTPPAGWTVHQSYVNVSGIWVSLCERITTADSETSGTWTGSSSPSVNVDVFRGGHIATSSKATGTSSSIDYPALTLTKTDNTSWIGAAATHLGASNVGTGTLSGYTNRTVTSSGNVAMFDTNGTTSTSPGTSSEVVNNSNTWFAFRYEIATPGTANTGQFFAFFR